MNDLTLLTAYRTLIETISDTVIMTDLEGRVVMWNTGAETAFGCTKEEMLGHPVGTIYAPEELERVRLVRDQVVTTGQPANLELLEIRKQDGKSLNILLSIVPIHNTHGAIQWLAGIGKDITSIRELERHAIASKQLESVHQLVVTLNHEMNQPLAVLNMTLAMMVKKLGHAQPVSEEECTMALKQVTRLAGLLQQIRNIKRVVNTEYLLGEQMVDLQQSLLPSDDEAPSSAS